MSTRFSSFHLGGEGQRPQLPHAIQEEIRLLSGQEEVRGESAWAALACFVTQPLIPELGVVGVPRQRRCSAISRRMESRIRHPQ